VPGSSHPGGTPRAPRAIRQFSLLLLVLVADSILTLRQPALGWQAVKSSLSYLGEMMLVLPPVLILVGLLEVWVSRQAIIRTMGAQSGLRGFLVALMAGSVAAGPLYAAFPAAESLSRKGCSTFNLCVLLCSWASIKIPMLVMEARFLGWAFTFARLVFTLPAIVAISWLTDRLAPSRSVCEEGHA